MNKEFLLTVMIILTVALSVSTIHASDVNITDTYTSISDDTYMAVDNSNVDNDSSNDNILKSDNSDTLSTNTGSNSLLENDDNANALTSSSEDNLSAKISASKTIVSSDLTKYHKGSEKYTATFYDINGNLLKNTDVQLTINTKTYTVKTDTKGVASLAIGLAPGTYKMVAYNPVTKYKLTNTITVLPTVSSKDLTKYYKGSEKYTATFYDSKGNLLKNTDVQLTINTKTYTVKTDTKGVASLAIGLAPGTYKMAAYNPVTKYSLTTTITVVSTISSKDLTKYYKGSEKYTATFRDTKGNLLKSTDVQLTINTKTYTVKTNSKGVASLAIGLAPGSYKMAAKNPVNGESITTAITVLRTINATDITKIYTDGRLFYATFLTSEGKPLANQNVKFKINGQTYTRTTNSNGLASLSMTNLRVGTYTMVSTNVDGSTLSNTVKVIASTSSKLVTKEYTFNTDETKVITVRLLNGLGYAPGAGKTITFNVNGKSYTANTDSNGDAKLTLPSLSAGTYTVRYSYAGNSFYTASSATNKVNIITNNVPAFTVKSSTTFIKGAGSDFKVVLTLDNQPLSGKTVTFKINGASYSKTTDSNGVASLPISLAVGKYTITYTNKADSKITSVTGSSNIEVVNKYPTTLTWKSATTLNTGKNTFKVMLSNSNGAISGATVKLVANSKTYTATTGSDGVAKFSVNLPDPGKYTIKYNYAGNTQNAAGSGSKSITIQTKAITIQGIIDASSTIKSYYASNKKLPDTVTADGVKFTMPEFLYLMSKTIQQLDTSDKSDIAYITGVSEPSASSGDSIKANLYKSDYLNVANSLVDYIKSNNKAPNYVSSPLGKLSFPVITEAFSRVVAFYGTNDQLPNYVSITSEYVPISSKISIDSIVTTATGLKTYFETNKNLPTSLTTGGIEVTMPEFLYLMSKAIYQLGNSDKSDIAYISGISTASSPSGNSINANLNKADYLTVANNIANFITSNKQAPNYASSTLGKLSYPIVSDAFARILSYYGTNKQLPGYVAIDSSSGPSPDPDTGQQGTGLNEKNTITNLDPYLLATKNCQVNNTAIKNLVDSLTSGLTSDLDKAVAIYNYVRDSISYTFYYDTRYGAVGTLNAKTGNCVDQAHLLIAMYRTAGLHARYVHGASCTFSSGTYGHVWAQVLIGDNWVVSDPTSSRNSFGKIVNWNTNTFTLKGVFREILF